MLWMPPEVQLGWGGRPAADVFSFGVMLLVALSYGCEQRDAKQDLDDPALTRETDENTRETDENKHNGSDSGGVGIRGNEGEVTTAHAADVRPPELSLPCPALDRPSPPSGCGVRVAALMSDCWALVSFPGIIHDKYRYDLSSIEIDFITVNQNANHFELT